MSMLQIEQVSKLYRASDLSGGVTPALRQVSFGIERGEIVTLIGESGSGKSTLGKIVLRLITPSSGKVTFEGRDIADFDRPQLREYYRYVQGVFQDPFSSYNPIYKADRVFELIKGVYFRHLPRSDWDDKIEAALHAVTLSPEDVLGKYPHQLSGGQQQRLLIARALLLDVKLLIADEVISMLDASTRVDVLNLLVGLRESGLAILFITHDLSLGSYISDRTVILRRGAIAEMGQTEKVFGNPQHSYTRSLLEAVPQLHNRWHRPTEDELAVLASDRVNATGSSGPRTLRARRSFWPGRPDGSRRGISAALALELAPPQLAECEADHLVAQAEAS